MLLNTQVYGQLLAEFQPQVIINEEENERAIAIVATLAHKQQLTAEEDQLLELLMTLIEKFESENYSLGKLSNPLSRLKFLLEQNPLSESDIIELFGAKTPLDNLLNNNIEISQELAIKLGKRFKVDLII